MMGKRRTTTRLVDWRWWATAALMVALGAGTAFFWWYFQAFPEQLPHLPRIAS
jgi:hypothetical protein